MFTKRLATPIVVNRNALYERLSTVNLVALVLLLTWPETPPSTPQPHAVFTSQVNYYIAAGPRKLLMSISCFFFSLILKSDSYPKIPCWLYQNVHPKPVVPAIPQRCQNLRLSVSFHKNWHHSLWSFQRKYFIFLRFRCDWFKAGACSQLARLNTKPSDRGAQLIGSLSLWMQIQKSFGPPVPTERGTVHSEFFSLCVKSG